MSKNYNENKELVKFLSERLDRLLQEEYEERERAKMYQSLMLDRQQKCEKFEVSTCDSDTLPYQNIMTIEDDVNIEEEKKRR